VFQFRRALLVREARLDADSVSLVRSPASEAAVISTQCSGIPGTFRALARYRSAGYLRSRE